MAPQPAYELDWNLVRTFVAVAEGGSLAAASRQLGLAHPTVARHVAQLEGALGLVLFDRTRSGLSLNDDGQRLADQAIAMQREAIAFERLTDTVREQPPARVRVTTSELLMEMVPGLLVPDAASNSAMPVEFLVSDEQLNLLERQADIAVRHVRPLQQDLICRRLGAVNMVACASDDYLRRYPFTGSTEGHRFIDAIAAPRFREGAASVGFMFTDDQVVFRSDNLLAQRAAMRDGWGIAALPETMLEFLPDVRQLVDGDVAVAIEVWLVARPEIRNAHQLKTVYDELGDALSARLAQVSVA